MESKINIPYKKKYIPGTIANYIFILFGIFILISPWLSSYPYDIYLFIGLFIPSSVLSGIGLFSLGSSQGVLVDLKARTVKPYKTVLWIKFGNWYSIKDVKSIEVSTKTAGAIYYEGYMLYTLQLTTKYSYLPIKTSSFGTFYTKAECMEAAQSLEEATGVPLVIKIRN